MASEGVNLSDLVININNCCIFCLFHKDHVAQVCTYGMYHEFPQVILEKKTVKIDRKICIKCGLHPKNPKAVGCDHEFAKES